MICGHFIFFRDPPACSRGARSASFCINLAVQAVQINVPAAAGAPSCRNEVTNKNSHVGHEAQKLFTSFGYCMSDGDLI